MLALTQLESKIRTEYFQLVIIRPEESKSFKTNDIENFQLTRGLAAFYLKNFAACPDSKISTHITDGFKDMGIDAIYYNEKEKILNLIQTKWIKNGKGGIELGEIEKSISGIRKIMIPDLKEFNFETQSLLSEITDALLEPNIKIVFSIVTSTDSNLSTEIKNSLDNLIKEQNQVSEFLYYEYINLKSLHDILRKGSIDAPIDTDIMLHNWIDLKDPVKAVYGMINGHDLANLLHTHGKRIFSPNIRYFLGNTEVNNLILETSINSPELFWYLNNGITAISNSLSKKAIGGASHTTGIFTCKGFYIVNGAQTTGALHDSFLKGNDLNSVNISIRIIEIDETNINFATMVTRSTNTQNRVDSRDFVALDPTQDRIHQELLFEKIYYTYKSGDIIPQNWEGFGFEEAAISQACSQDDIDLMVLGKREISKLWQLTDKPPYKRLFFSGTNSLELYYKVKLLRKIESFINHKRINASSRENLILVHGNRFIALLVFRILNKTGISLDKLSDTDIETAFTNGYTALKDQIELDYPIDQLASLFKNNDKCKKINGNLSI
ncbi:AIPR family protein [Leptospira sp. 96542]|nr:AIPR family protein [Leptospira sp. 96542]